MSDENLAALWKAAFIEERILRYIDRGSKVEQARILAETDASRMEIRLQSAGRRGIERELLVGFIEAYRAAQSEGVIQARTTEVLL